MKYVSRLGNPALAELYGRMFPGVSIDASGIVAEENKEHDSLIVTYPELAINLKNLGVKHVKTKYELKDFEAPVCLGDMGNPAKELFFLYMVHTFGQEYLEDYLKAHMGLAIHIQEYEAGLW